MWRSRCKLKAICAALRAHYKGGILCDGSLITAGWSTSIALFYHLRALSKGGKKQMKETAKKERQ